MSGAIAFLIDFFGRFDARTWLESDRKRLHARLVRGQVGEVGAREEETLVPAGR